KRDSRRHGPIALDRLERERNLDDICRKSFREALEGRDVERILTISTHADVTSCPAVAAVSKEDAASRRDPESDIRLVHGGPLGGVACAVGDAHEVTSTTSFNPTVCTRLSRKMIRTVTPLGPATRGPYVVPPLTILTSPAWC